MLGNLEDIVLDPVRSEVTHLVVHVPDQPLQTRLVPIRLAELTSDGAGVLLGCSLAEASDLTPLRQFANLKPGELPAVDSRSTVGVRDLITMPQYETGAFEGYRPEAESGIGMIYDSIPKGEVELRQTSAVVSPDDHEVGTVDGLILDEYRIAQIVVRCGHLWRRREIALPIAAVARWSTDEVTIRLSADELKSYPVAPGTHVA